MADAAEPVGGGAVVGGEGQGLLERDHGALVVPELLPRGGRGHLQGILFVNYHTPGAHRYPFDAKQVLKVSFGQLGLSFTP